MPVKVLDKYGSGTYADVADGIRWAADNGAKVINLSLGGSSPASYLEDAATYAHNKGVTIVAASGNDGSSSVSYPAAYDNYVIAVGAARYDETRAYYSNYGSSLDLTAPGGDLNVDQNKDGYGDGILQQTFGRTTNSWGYYFYQGTSMAAPHVAGVVALVISKGIAIAPDQVRAVLESTALNKWTQDSQNDWFRSAQRAINGSYSAEVDGLALNAKLTSISINLQGKTNATIAFSWFIESGLDSGEYIAFDVSTIISSFVSGERCPRPMKMLMLIW